MAMTTTLSGPAFQPIHALAYTNTIRLGIGFDAFWLVVIGWALLALASLLKRL